MDINFIKLNFCFMATKDSRLPPFLGSTLRGVFGERLLLRYCDNDIIDCRKCGKIKTCDFVKIFNRIDTTGDTRASLPNHYIIYHKPQNKTEYKKGDMLFFDVTLFGITTDYIKEIAEAIQSGCENGLGVYRYPFEYIGVNKRELSYKSEEISVESATVVFDTPLHIRSNSKGILRELTFHSFVRALLRRLTELERLSLPVCKIANLIEKAKLIKTVKYDMEFLEKQRYSNRDSEKKDISGLVGTISFEGDLFEFTDLLRLGEVFHVGKWCTLGLGHYELYIR